MRIAIVVLGPLGHSPRMINHTLAAARNGLHVELIGYGRTFLIFKLLSQIM